jgi:ABC-2 type transport system permease protein
MQNFWTLLKREFKLFWQNKVLRLLLSDTVALWYFVRLRLWQRKSNRSTDYVVDEDRSEMSSKAMQMFDDNEVLDITSLLYDQNNLSKIVIDEEAVCVVIIPKGFEFLPSDIRNCNCVPQMS